MQEPDCRLQVSERPGVAEALAGPMAAQVTLALAPGPIALRQSDESSVVAVRSIVAFVVYAPLPNVASPDPFPGVTDTTVLLQAAGRLEPIGICDWAQVEESSHVPLGSPPQSLGSSELQFTASLEEFEVPPEPGVLLLLPHAATRPIETTVK